MMDYDLLVVQLRSALQKKSEIEKHISVVKRDLLDTPEIREQIAPLHNEGGEKTQSGITVEIPKKHSWDQSILAEILNEIPQEKWPSFVDRLTTYKVDMRSFTKAAVSNPATTMSFNRAHKIELGKPKISKVKEEKDV
jgi:hypothetical protein